MRPRTKLQCQVVEYSQGLCNIDNSMVEWVKEDVFDHIGFSTKSRTICMDCGESFSPEIVKRKRAVCPHCGAKLKIETSRKTTNKQSTYIAKAQIYGEFQVIRNFEIYGYYKAGLRPHFFIREVLQHWIKDDGKREVMALGRNTGCSGWGGTMEIRRKQLGTYYYRYGNNDINVEMYHPDSEFRDKYKRYGIDHNFRGMSFLTAINMLPINSKAETLLKAKEYKLFGWLDDYKASSVSKYWSAIKICLRNRYKVKDISLWFDYLELLEHYHKDLHNAYYVCPKNLKKAHNIYVKKKRKDDERERKERAIRKLLSQKEVAELYIKEKSKFFGIRIFDENISIHVLESVDEFKEEGDKMHHCVFDCEYFNRKDCLILSARNKKTGKRIETIELSLSTFEIIQQRAKCNGESPYKAEIKDLIINNIGQFKKLVIKKAM